MFKRIISFSQNWFVWCVLQSISIYSYLVYYVCVLRTKTFHFVENFLRLKRNKWCSIFACSVNAVRSIPREARLDLLQVILNIFLPIVYKKQLFVVITWPRRCTPGLVFSRCGAFDKRFDRAVQPGLAFRPCWTAAMFFVHFMLLALCESEPYRRGKCLCLLRRHRLACYRGLMMREKY